MLLRIPDYYRSFSCIGGRCEHSCCLGWEIDIDEETWEYYRSIQGPFGDRLRANMVSTDENSFRLVSGNRCPFLNAENLCDIYIELGETSLCAICTEYPRQTLEYADVRERCLSISCEEVGRILFSKKEKVAVEEQELEDIEMWTGEEFGEDAESGKCTGEGADSYDEYGSNLHGNSGEALEDVEEDALNNGEDFYDREDSVDFEYVYVEDEEDDSCPEAERGEHLRKMRDHAITILQRRESPIEHRILRYLRFAHQVQEYINQEMWEEMDELPALEEGWESMDEAADAVMGEDLFDSRSLVLKDMEILDEEWEDVFRELCDVYEDMDAQARGQLIRNFMTYYREREYEYEHLMVYYTFRYCLKSIFDYQFLAKAQLAVLSFLTIRDMDAVHFRKTGAFTLQDRIDLARIYSREVEHSEDNLEYLADEFVFTPELGWESLGAQVMLGKKEKMYAEYL